MEAGREPDEAPLASRVDGWPQPAPRTQTRRIPLSRRTPVLCPRPEQPDVLACAALERQMTRLGLSAAACAVALGLCVASPAAAGQTDDLRALIEQQRAQIAELAKRVADLEQALAKPAAEAAAPARED